MTPTVDLAALKISDFAPHLGTMFDMQTSGGTIALKLTKVDAAGESGRPGGAFSLIFVAPTGRWPQAIYPVTHPALGTMEIFLVPVGPASGGSGYQAIFT